MATKKAERVVKPPSFRNLMTFRLHRVARISERMSEQYYRKHLDMSLPECRVIGITAGYTSVSFKRVAAAANLEKSYASRVVSALVDRGFMEKLVNPSDSRSTLLTLTEQGHAVHEQTYSLALRLNELLQRPFKRGQVDDFVSFLGTLELQMDQTSGLIESGGDFSAAPPLTASDLDSSEADPIPPTLLDRAFAAELHDMLGRYLAESD